MSFIRFVFLSVSFFLLTSQPLLADMPTPEELEAELSGKGLQGWIHAAVASKSQYVFTYRDPEDFFSHYEFPLVASEPQVETVLKTLTRHDSVLVKGHFLANGAPIKHISASEVMIVKKFESGVKAKPYQYEAKLPQDLEGKTELIGKVHAVVEEGKILVIEYKDTVVPIFVRDNTLTKNLFRNDKIKMKYVLRKSPHQPTHLTLDTKAKNPLEVMERLEALHHKPASIEGYLVLFPKSPQVLFNVFAIQVVDKDGVKREYTLLNFEDPEVFRKIREKLQAFWDKDTTKVVDARNKFINLGVKLRAVGKFNVVDANQANPQVMLEGPEGLTLVP